VVGDHAFEIGADDVRTVSLAELTPPIAAVIAGSLEDVGVFGVLEDPVTVTAVRKSRQAANRSL